MWTSVGAFKVGLYEEHIEEVSFLYEQSRVYLRDSQFPWPHLGDLDQRLEAHIDALVIGGDLALKVCRERSNNGDFGELFAAVSIFCRQRRANFLSEILNALDYTDGKKVRAVTDALKYELPGEWSNFIERAFGSRDARLTPILATVSSYRRLPTGAALQRALVNAVATTTIVEALGRMKTVEAREDLERCVQNSDVRVKSAALLALLQIGMDNPLPKYYLDAQRESWPHIALGLGGDRSACQVLLEVAQSAKADSDCLLALGLLGDPSALQSLYDSLKNPNLVDSAALALNWITGAQLFEDVFVPDEVNEDELFENELQAWRERKEAPKRADGKPFGQTIRKLSPNKETWKRWFADNAAKFDMNLRYRSGKPYTPGGLLENLAEEGSDHKLRKFAAEELVIRYGCDVPFEVDMPVIQQLRAIQEIQAWVHANGNRFQPGLWYFSGSSQ